MYIYIYIIYHLHLVIHFCVPRSRTTLKYYSEEERLYEYPLVL